MTDVIEFLYESQCNEEPESIPELAELYETESEILWRFLACYVRDHTMKSCQPLGSRLINKAFRAMQESDKPQHSMLFPGTLGGFSFI